MKMMLEINYPSPGVGIQYNDPVMVIGSCFTEHIGKRLIERKFKVLQNPNGILFDPLSVASALLSYTREVDFKESDLTRIQDVWYHWQYHGRYSSTNPQRLVAELKQSHSEASAFLKNCRWLIITLGSSFSYRLRESETPVANCHKAPADIFRKHLLSITEIESALDSMYHQLLHFNPNLRIIFTISPVRHIRDGVIENNRSKARLIEAVHHLVNKFDAVYYFPAYEIVIDVLRDYRFYDIDLVHPNYPATEYVFEEFSKIWFPPDVAKLSQEIASLANAARHRPMHPDTSAHRRFLETHAVRARQLMEQYPFLDLNQELSYFTGAH
jgi:hypothetical protein